MDDRVLPAVYLLASRRHGTLYLGSTAHLIRRIWEHREASGSHFSAKYEVTRLVWYERTRNHCGRAQSREVDEALATRMED